MPDESRWYVVHTYSGYENKVASNLETTVENRFYVDRGYEDICRDLRLLGACVQDG